MADSHDNRGDQRSAAELTQDTNITAPWPFFLFEAFKQNRGQAMIWVIAGFLPVVAIGGYLALAIPAMAQQLPILIIFGYGLATYLAERNMCRTVIVIRPDEHRVMIDEQRWWREDERQLADAFKYHTGQRSEAWLYPVDGGYAPFVAWAESLEVDDDTATASHVAGIRTTMGSAERVARHRQRDNSEIARYGWLTLIILSGLLATYLAGSKAIDAFVGN